jgi:hypothetical protein
MAILQVKGIDDNLYAELKEAAESENRSVSQQVIHLLRLYLAKKEQFDRTMGSAEVLIELSGAWKDDRSAQQIVKDLRGARKISRKLEEGF